MKSFDEIRDYYYCILKIRLGVDEFNKIINDFTTEEIFYHIKHKYESISQLPNHIHITSLLNKFRIGNEYNYMENNKMLLRSIFLLSKFQSVLNPDFKLKPENEMINVLIKIVSEYEQFILHSTDNQN